MSSSTRATLVAAHSSNLGEDYPVLLPKADNGGGTVGVSPAFHASHCRSPQEVRSVSLTVVWPYLHFFGLGLQLCFHGGEVIYLLGRNT